MKFVIVILMVTHTIDYNVMYDYVFYSYKECIDFQLYANANLPSDSNYVFWCQGVKNERKTK